MPTPNDPSTQNLTPDGLANQLFDAAILQYKDPREAARAIIMFLAEATIYAISSSTTDDTSRKALLKSVGDTIASAPPLQKGGAKPPAAAPAGKP